MTQQYSGVIQEEVIRFVGEHHPIQRPVTLKSTGAEKVLKGGTVLAQITVGGLYVPFAPAADDGSQNAKCILTESVVVPAEGNEPETAYVHGEFFDSGLTWPEGISAEDKQTAIDSLSSQGVYVV